MTVQDLIRYLEKLPKNTVIGVVYQAYSDYSILDENDLQFFDKRYMDEQNEKIASGAWVLYRERRQFVLRHGNIMEYDEKTWPETETPQFVPILVLPGN